mmetsp:Transcript_1268/g.1697  ORF Transcript_1268/g.1697 Transcript_1268/m.1697 type:complete len:236 (+) Transcript_1268:1101-1808(+)
MRIVFFLLVFEVCRVLSPRRRLCHTWRNSDAVIALRLFVTFAEAALATEAKEVIAASVCRGGVRVHVGSVWTVSHLVGRLASWPITGLIVACIVSRCLFLVSQVDIGRVYADLASIEDGDGAVRPLIAMRGLGLNLKRVASSGVRGLRLATFWILVPRQSDALIEGTNALFDDCLGQLDEARPLIFFEFEHELKDVHKVVRVAALLQPEQALGDQALPIVLLALLVKSSHVFHRC